MICLHCNEPTTNPKFCSSSCAAKHNNTNRKRSEESKQKTSKALKDGIASGRIKPRTLPSRLGISRRPIVLDYMTYPEYRRRSKFRIKDFTGIPGNELIEVVGWYDLCDQDKATKDHLYSISEGWRNKISPELLRHPANCRIISFKENRAKSDSSTITLEELKDRIANWRPHQDSNPEP